ncbi:MAG: glycosyltransferase family 2 protein [Candidatus Gastranaerophilales bacterium]|nr:glycosyltransferase family 2 protein [Candidatus Gastranaerophilales bacterium]
MKKLAVIVPCYNEEEVFLLTQKALSDLLNRLISLGKISNDSFVCFVNDGSKDTTWELISGAAQNSSIIKGINLSRNFGHQGALIAGLFNLDADYYVSIDADLQDDENAIEQMVDLADEGSEIVYGVRKERKTDSVFKRETALMFYRVMGFLGVEIVHNHADYRLLTKRAVETLKQFQEKNLFIRAMIPLLGYKSAKVFYDRKKRLLGESKYPLKKMLSFAWEGITSFSVKPLRLVTTFGMLTCLLSLALIVYSVVRYVVHDVISGWSSLIIAISLFSGVQLLCLGIIGEYIGKLYKEAKNRPSYIISEII